jgi:hypothetical protein
MSTIRSVLAAVLILGSSATAVWSAQSEPSAAATDLDLLLSTIRANRRALVSVNLNLSEAEAAQFWPLYDRYQTEMNAFGDRLAALIQDYTANFRTLTNEKALQLVKDYLTIEADRIKVRRTYLDEFAKVLPGRTVARFYQIDNKMDAVIRYDLAAAIPVVEEQASAPAAREGP